MNLLKRVILICMFGLLANQANALEQGWYAGLGIAQTRVEHNAAKLNQSYPNVGHVENKNYGLKVFTGYWFDEYLGMEVSIQDVPQYTAKDSFSSTKLYGMNNYAISVLARRPVGEHEIFAKAGLSIWKVCTNTSCSTELESGQSLSYGAGININLYDSGDRVMRFEWEHTAIDSVYLDSLDVFSLNIVFNFNGPE